MIDQILNCNYFIQLIDILLIHFAYISIDRFRNNDKELGLFDQNAKFKQTIETVFNIIVCSSC